MNIQRKQENLLKKEIGILWDKWETLSAEADLINLELEGLGVVYS